MPKGDPWPAVELLLKTEVQIRTTGTFQGGILDRVDPYWADLIRLLQVFRCKKDNDADQIKALCRIMSSNVYFPFIEKVLNELT
jgi:thymidylate synthase